MDEGHAIEVLEGLGRKFSDEQLEILSTKGGIELLAVAGSGKTFTMTNLIAKRILTEEIKNPANILCSTFSKVGAEEMEGRLNKILKQLRLPSVSVKTMHALFYQILSAFGMKFNKVLSEGERSKLLRDAAKKVNNSYSRLSNDDIAELGNTISLQVNELLSDGELFISSKYRISIPPYDYTSIRQEFGQMKAASGAVDFDDMQAYIYNWLVVYKYQNVLDWCRDRWKYFFVDEFQDTNVIQLAILQAMLGEDDPSSRLVVVGDDDQCVYEWRGTDPRILINIGGYFDLKKLLLTTNYRCPNAVVEKAYNCVVNMSERENKQMRAYKDGGSVEVLDCSYVEPKDRVTDSDISNDSCIDNKLASSKWKNTLNIASEVVASRVADSLSGKYGICGEREFCCLSRTNANLRILSNMLFQRGIIVRNSKGMRISSCREWTVFKRILNLANKNAFISNLAVSDIVWQIVNGSNGRFGKLVSSVIAEAQCSLDWALEKILDVYEREGIFFKGGGVILGDSSKCGKNMTAKTEMSLLYEAGHSKISRQSIVDVINALRLKDEGESAIRLLGLCRVASAFMYQTSDLIRLFDAMMEYFRSIVRERGREGAERYINIVEQSENSSDIGDSRIEMRTIHGAKGGEWKNVFLLMDDNKTFPNFDLIRIMSENGVSDSELERYADSERRLHYVAQTRASERLYCIGEGDKLSKFILESYQCGGKNSDILESAKKGRHCNTIGIDAVLSGQPATVLQL